MNTIEIPRKALDNQEFLKLRQNTEKISGILTKRLKEHLNVLKSLFLPRKLLGTYLKSADMDDVPGSDKAFAELQERYGAVCEKPFELPKKLQTPLPSISSNLEVTPFQYSILFAGEGAKPVSITAPTCWILSYRTDCPLTRLGAMVSGTESRQADDMKQSIIDHLSMAIFLKRFPALVQLLQDLRYKVETVELEDLGGLSVIVLKSPIEAFLPPDEFIDQITQLSGIPAFQEIIDLEAVENISDPLKNVLKDAIS